MALTGCRSSEPVPSVHAIADNYGPITGKLAEVAASGEAARIVAAGNAEERRYTLGTGRSEVRVTEHWILGEPFQIETVSKKYLDPITGIEDRVVRRMAHGCGIDIGALITGKKQQRQILRLLRTESYKETCRMARRSYRDRTGQWVEAGGRKKSAWSAGSDALILDIGTEEDLSIHGPLHGCFVTTRGNGDICCFINPPLAEFLATLLPHLRAEKEQRLGAGWPDR
jgi:hypothetical protein